ncbi:MAG: PadR family transcriptional regulator [Culicoidibacterales bacterium]
MSLKQGILGLLTGENKTGYDIHKCFDQSIGFFWKSSRSQVYRELDLMEKQGWVKSRAILQEGKPNKKLYEITSTGQQVHQKWLKEYEITKELEFRISLLIRTYFSDSRPKEELITILENYSLACGNALKTLEKIPLESYAETKSENSVYINATLSYGINFYKMLMSWCKETIDEINKIRKMRNIK